MSVMATALPAGALDRGARRVSSTGYASPIGMLGEPGFAVIYAQHQNSCRKPPAGAHVLPPANTKCPQCKGKGRCRCITACETRIARGVAAAVGSRRS